MNKLIPILFFGLLASSGAANAQFYLGAAAGMSQIKPNIDSPAEISQDSDIAYRGSLGYQMSPKFGFEFFYTDLGIAKFKSAGKEFEAPFNMYGGSVMVLPFGRASTAGFNWLLELGIGSLGVDEKVGVSKDNEYQLVLGTGLQYNFGELFGVRALVENYATDVNVFTLGANINFGRLQSEPEAEAAPAVLIEPEAPAPVAEPEPIVVAAPAAPVDTDGDGVPDNIDCCPNTAAGLQVNEFGCPSLDQRLQNINFAYKSQNLTKVAEQVLDGIAETMAVYPSSKIELGAYTDSIGSAGYNLKLSQQRADSARNYLISKGIDASRLSAKGYGESNPIADNASEDGRLANRRVELKLIDKGTGMQGCQQPAK